MIDNNNYDIQQVKSTRIEYIDAMRGFTMLLVVYSHILTFGYSGEFERLFGGGGKLLSFNELFVIFRMPLFFFISGFILYRKDLDWTLPASGRFLLKKAKVQILPTAFFMTLFVSLVREPLLNAITDPAKAGYWFTLTLFEYFIIYVGYRLISNLLHKKDGCDILLIIIATGVFAISRPEFFQTMHVPKVVIGLMGLVKLNYFVYFAMGTLIKKHFKKVESLMDKGSAKAMLLLSFIGIVAASYMGVPFADVLKRFTGFIGVLVVFATFRHYQAVFTQEHHIGRVLQFIGRRTLDVYLLHYFFLPHNLGGLGEFFASGNNYTIEFFVTILIASMVITLSLGLSAVIRTSPILAHWLFGVKIR